MAKCQLINSQITQNILESCDNFLFDCDGVLWNGNKILPGAPNVINKLRQLGKKVFFITNNNTKTKLEFLQKCTKLGFEANPEEMICTANLTANYLKDIDFQGKVYLIGSLGLTGEFDAAGIHYLEIGPDPVPSPSINLAQTYLDPEVKAVVVGFDEHISYIKLLKAASYLSDPNCLFIATNTDGQIPMDNSRIVIPGTGSIVKAVEIAANREPVILGKPHHYIFEFLQKNVHIDPERTIMIGDRLDTDILLAHNCKLKSMLLLTGVSSLAEVHKYMASNSIIHQKLIPDYYLPEIGGFLEMLEGK